MCLGCVTISFNVAAIAAAIPTISSDLGLPAFLVSKIIPCYMIPYGIGALIYAPLSQWVSFRVILAVSMGLYAATSFFCAIAPSINYFFAARIVMGLVAASAIPLGLLLIGKLFDKEVRGRLVGLFFSSNFIASILGIVASGTADWRWLFYIPAIIGAGTSLSFFVFGKHILNEVHGAPVNYLKAYHDAKIRNVFIYIFIISLLFHGVTKWLGVYLDRDYQLDQLTISFFFIVLSVAGAIGQNLGGFLTDKVNRFTSCYIGLVLLAVATILLAGIYPLVVLGLILIVLQVGWTVGHNGASTVLTDFPDDIRPETASLNSSVRFISGGIGFFISGFFVEKSFGMTFLGLGIVMLLLSFFLGRFISEDRLYGAKKHKASV